LKENPDRLAQVLVLLRHLKVIDREEKTTDSPEGSKLQAIGSVLLAVTRGSYSGAKFLILAVARGSYSGAKFLILLLFTTLSDFVKMEAEIPKEKIGEYDRMKRSFKEVEVKLKEVEQDVGKMKEEMKHAVEDDYKISNADDKRLEMGLVNAECDLDSCEDGMSYIREDNRRLPLEAKDAITSVQNLLATVKVVITGMIFVAALAAGYLYHWNRLEKVGSFEDDDDDTEKRPTTYVVATGCLIVALVVLFCRNQAQKLFNNKKLLAECERFQHDDLPKVELLQKDLKRDVKVKLPACKNQLVPLYVPLQPRFKSE